MKHFSIKRIIYYFKLSYYYTHPDITDINLQRIFIYVLFIVSLAKKVTKKTISIIFFVTNCNCSIRFFYTLSSKLIFLTFQKNSNCLIQF